MVKQAKDNSGVTMVKLVKIDSIEVQHMIRKEGLIITGENEYGTKIQLTIPVAWGEVKVEYLD